MDRISKIQNRRPNRKLNNISLRSEGISLISHEVRLQAISKTLRSGRISLQLDKLLPQPKPLINLFIKLASLIHPMSSKAMLCNSMHYLSPNLELNLDTIN